MRRGQGGAATVEAAFSIPLFLALTGCVAFAGWLGAAQAIVSHGAREGARYASVPSAADLRAWPDEAQVLAAVDGATPLLTPSQVRLVEQPGGRNAPLHVEVTYAVRNPVAVLFAPLRALGIGGGVPDTITLRASAEVRRE